MSASTSLILATNCSGVTLVPRSNIWNPLAERMVATRFLPIRGYRPAQCRGRPCPNLTLRTAFQHLRFEYLDSRLHRLGRRQQIGQEHLAAAELFASERMPAANPWFTASRGSMPPASACCANSVAFSGAPSMILWRIAPKSRSDKSLRQDQLLESNHSRGLGGRQVNKLRGAVTEEFCYTRTPRGYGGRGALGSASRTISPTLTSPRDCTGLYPNCHTWQRLRRAETRERSMLKTNPRYISPLKWPTRQKRRRGRGSLGSSRG